MLSPRIVVLIDNKALNLYKLAFTALFKIPTITVLNVKDCLDVSPYDIVILCADADIQGLCSEYAGRIYAITDLPPSYINMFDHVFCKTVLDSKNSTQIPEILLSLRIPKFLTSSNRLRIGLYLDKMTPDIESQLKTIQSKLIQVEYHLFSPTPFQISLPYILHPIDDVGFIGRNIDIVLSTTYLGSLCSKITQTKYITDFTTEAIYKALRAPLESVPSVNTYDIVNQLIVLTSKTQAIPVDQPLTLEETYTKCAQEIPSYLNITQTKYNLLLNKVGPFNSKPHDPKDFAIFLCYLITKQISHPCIWGLMENMSKPDFRLKDAISNIWGTQKLSTDYFPTLKTFKRKALINLDFLFQKDFKNIHRSGWSYVVGGLMNLDAPRLLRKSQLLVDTYVDRSFHWGADTLKALKVIPYTNPWIGFIHHTFDTTHSEYNCTKLFENPDFIESLKTCKAIITLSDTLANQIAEKLTDIQVYVLTHPTEFVDNMFTMQKFLSNPNKKVVQVGAWLRNPYAIYELSLGNNPLNVTKAALKGREMDQYFAPANYLTSLQAVLMEPTHASSSSGCSKNPCRPKNTTNKYCEGAYNMLEVQYQSVSVIEHIENDEFDTLLSENVVFLNLIDCSAVNTVIECVVRNTPLVINRLPALEELLGKQYPGFYGNLTQAATLCTDLNLISQMSLYISKLDKTKYMLETFIEDFQSIILNLDKQVTQPSRSQLFVTQPSGKLTSIQRFLPIQFQQKI